ncbi:PAX-interacting protein 1-like [Myripristis murdjan]|uniref:PAX-interacting protein 1-like n=1 Tax=Myripristis murdjan TaxID=586833 RepID=UPI0011762A8F|nr:PAX-interacting protein 1-like [Myripristis murdjan]
MEQESADEEKSDLGSEVGAWRRGVLSRGVSHEADSGVFTDAASADSMKHHKSRSHPQFLGLSPCAACYNQQGHSMLHRGDNDSSSDDSGRELDWDSEEAESSSNSSCSSGPVSAGLPPKAESGSGDVFEFGSEVGEGAGLAEETNGQGAGQEVMEESRGERKETMVRRAPLVKSFSLPPSLTHSLVPFSLLPRPPRVVSTLQLQVLPSKDDDATFHITPTFTHQHPSEMQGKRGNGNLLPPQPSQLQQMGLPWQHRSPQQPTNQQHQYQHQYQQQQRQQHQLAQHYQQQRQWFFPAWRHGYPPPPPPHTFPVLHTPTAHTHPHASYTPHTHLHALAPQTCCYCYNTHRPIPYTYWNQYSGYQPSV